MSNLPINMHNSNIHIKSIRYEIHWARQARIIHRLLARLWYMLSWLTLSIPDKIILLEARQLFLHFPLSICLTGIVIARMKLMNNNNKSSFWKLAYWFHLIITKQKICPWIESEGDGWKLNSLFSCEMHADSAKFALWKKCRSIENKWLWR